MHHLNMQWTMAALALAMVAGSCRKAAPPAGPSREHYDALMKADMQMQQGQTREALQTLEDLLWKRDYQDVRGEVGARLIFYYLNTNDVAQAEQKYLEIATRDKNAGARCYGMIENALFTQQRYADLLAWCERVEAAGAGGQPPTAVADWRFRAAYAAGDKEAAVTVLTAYVSKLKAADWQAMVSRFGQFLVQARDGEAVDRLLKYLDGQLATQPALLQIRATLQLSLFITESQWDQAAAYLHGLPDKVSDQVLNGLFGMLADHLARAGQLDQLEKECRYFIYTVKDRPVTREAAVQRYYRAALQRENVDLALDRIAELQKAGYGNGPAAGWMDALYPIAMKSGTTNDFARMVVMSEDLLKGLKDDRLRASLAGIILDTGFRAQMFQSALRVLEAGVPGQDAKWHQSMINKVKAHIALQEGRKEEAVERFKRFMEESAAKMEDTVDPISGDRITRDMVLALNARRIGNLLAELDKRQEAQDYFAQARTHYEAALKATDPNSGQYKRLQSELESLPRAP